MYVGIDHSTTGIKVSCIGDDRPSTAFRIDRRDLEDVGSVLDVIDNRVGTSAIRMATLTYSYGNGISKVEDIHNVSKRGVNDLLGLGYETGAGAAVFDQLRDSTVPTVVLPGVHSGLDPLHPYFKHYSTLSGADKVAAMRYALERFRSEHGGDPSGNFIWACASSSCMAGLVCDGKVRGFFHWLGLVHGWPDPEALRRGLESGMDDVYMRCGLLARNGRDLEDAHDISDREILEHVYFATLQNIHSLYPFAREFGSGSLEAIVLSGRLMRREQPVEIGRRVYERCLDVAPVLFSEPYTSARGAALVARDVERGREEVLGIPVGDVPASG